MCGGGGGGRRAGGSWGSSSGSITGSRQRTGGGPSLEFEQELHCFIVIRRHNVSTWKIKLFFDLPVDNMEPGYF